ncbi:hypothetical protein DB35_21985, partial [Streptomyces abyssalis]
MSELAHWHGGAGPGPWMIPLFLLIWAPVIAGVAVLLRRFVRRGGRGPWNGPWNAPWQGRGPAAAGGPRPENSPVDLLGRRFAEGDIDEDEYWRR